MREGRAMHVAHTIPLSLPRACKGRGPGRLNLCGTAHTAGQRMSHESAACMHRWRVPVVLGLHYMAGYPPKTCTEPPSNFVHVQGPWTGTGGPLGCSIGSRVHVPKDGGRGGQLPQAWARVFLLLTVLVEVASFPVGKGARVWVEPAATLPPIHHQVVRTVGETDWQNELSSFSHGVSDDASEITHNAAEFVEHLPDHIPHAAHGSKQV